MIDPKHLPELRFPIGTEFKTRGKRPDTCTVTDHLYTFNSKGELVKTRYVATHEFCGQVVTDHNVPEATIAMALFTQAENSKPKKKPRRRAV